VGSWVVAAEAGDDMEFMLKLLMWIRDSSFVVARENGKEGAKEEAEKKAVTPSWF
jgi:hypothetical protein